jgi:hypothetical protein
VQPEKIWHSHASRHGCCCWHVVNHFEAMPGPEEERFALAKDKLAICPHTDVRTELELYVQTLRDTADV